MSHTYKKIKFTQSGFYGSIDEEYLYFDANNSCDITTVYDQRGHYLFNMGEALKVAFTNWQDKRMETVSWDEWDEIVGMQ